LAEEKNENESTLVERWLEDQLKWQKTAMAYFDSMVKSDDFLVNLGNAMRGSLLAGKPYPGTAAPDSATTSSESAADERIDKILFALHQIQGQLTDLQLTVDELAAKAQREPAEASATDHAGGTRRYRARTRSQRIKRESQTATTKPARPRTRASDRGGKA